MPIILLACAWQAQAVHFTSSQVGPTTWRYDLTFDPLDNYSIYQANTTITLTGLSGVTAAAGPTSTDFDPPGGALDLLNKAWTAQVLNSGTTVVWTHVGGGTGNFGSAKHAFGFSITSNSANGTASFSTSGFARDAGVGGNNTLDISGSVAGPSATPAAPTPTAQGAPAMSPLVLALTFLALAGAGSYYAKHHLQTRFGR